MLGQERELALLPAGIHAALQQLPERPKAIHLMAERHFAGPVDLLGGVSVRQRSQPYQHPQSRHAAGLEHRFAPSRRVRSDQPRLTQQPFGSALDLRELPRVNVAVVGAGAARLLLHVHRDHRHLLVEDPHQVPVPTRPHPTAHVFRRNRVIRLGHLHVPVAMDAALGFAERSEPPGRQRQQRRRLDLLEHLAHLLPRRAVNPRVRHARLPGQQVSVRRRQRREPPALQRVVLDVADAPLDLPLVTRRVRLRRQHHRAVVLAERLHLRVQLRIEPVRILHRRLQVVDHQRLRHPAEVPERILQRPEECVRRLAEHVLAVALPRMAQNDPEDVRLPPPTPWRHDRRTRPKINLRLGARLAFHPPERQRPGPSQPTNVPLDAVVAAAEAVLAHQVLPDPNPAETASQLDLDDLHERLARTGRTSPRAGGRVGGTV